MADDLLENESIKAIGENHAKAIGQVILSWQVQSGFMPIPRSSSSVYRQETIALFDF